MTLQISPSLLSANPARIGEQIKELDPHIDSWHFDVMDGKFVENYGLDIDLLKRIRPLTKKPITAHLMVNDPENVVKQWAEAGADVIEFHIEATKNPGLAIRRIHAAKKRTGIAIKPRTPLSRIRPYLGDVDVVLVMSVVPGKSGQPFIDVTKKIKALHMLFLGGDIEVDGGIKSDTIGRVCKAGANIFVSGSGIFGKPNIVSATQELRALLK